MPLNRPPDFDSDPPATRYTWAGVRSVRVRGVSASPLHCEPLGWDEGELRERIEHASRIKRGLTSKPGPFGPEEVAEIVRLLTTSNASLRRSPVADPETVYDPDAERSKRYVRLWRQGWRPWDRWKNDWLRQRFPRIKRPKEPKKPKPKIVKRLSLRSQPRGERCSLCGSTSYCVDYRGWQADRPTAGCPRGYDKIHGVGPGIAFEDTRRTS